MALSGIGTWHIRFTKFASVHVTHEQEQVNSCGIACILMINFKMKKGQMATGVAAGLVLQTVPVVGGYLGAQMTSQALDYAVKTEPVVYKAYSAVTGSPYDGTSYTDCLNHPAVLTSLGCGNWETVWVGEAAMAAAITAAVAGGAPCICQVVWDAGGAHFVVVDETRTANVLAVAMVNDPGDGEVYPTLMVPGATIRYRSGKMSGWIVRRK